MLHFSFIAKLDLVICVDRSVQYCQIESTEVLQSGCEILLSRVSPSISQRKEHSQNLCHQSSIKRNAPPLT